MKPTSMYCQYCNLVDECKRTDCGRRALFPDSGGIKMVEPIEHNHWRRVERKRMYNELTLSKVDMITKYN